MSAVAHVYTIKLVRYPDEYELDTPRKLKAQVSDELQEAMDQSGLPVGFFNVTKVKPVRTRKQVNRILGRKS